MFFFFIYVIKHCFICRPSDFTVSEDAGIEPKNVATLAFTTKNALTTRLDLIHKIKIVGLLMSTKFGEILQIMSACLHFNVVTEAYIFKVKNRWETVYTC